MDRITFHRAANFLVEQLQAPGKVAQRAGVVVRVSFDGATNVAGRLRDIALGARARVDERLTQQIADLKVANHVAALKFNLSASMRLQPHQQIELLDEETLKSPMVTLAAAKQVHLAPNVEEHLVSHAFGHRSTMAEMARNLNVDLSVAHVLAGHPDVEVRLNLAANIGPRMRVVDPWPPEQQAKRGIYNRLVERLDDNRFVPLLVPVATNPAQIEQMYERAAKTPAVLRHFVDNPNTPEKTLLDISTLKGPQFLPGGLGVASDAKYQLEQRLEANERAREALREAAGEPTASPF